MKLFLALQAACLSSNGQTINPQRLKDRAIEAEALGFVYPPVLHTLIDRAIQRDKPALHTTA